MASANGGGATLGSDEANGPPDAPACQGSGPLRGVPEDIMQRAAGWGADKDAKDVGDPARPDGKKEQTTVEVEPVAGRASPTRSHALDVEMLSVISGLYFVGIVYYVNLALDDLRDDGRVTILRWSKLSDYFSLRTYVLSLALMAAAFATPLIAFYGVRAWALGRALLGTDSLHSGRLGRLWDAGCWLAALLLAALLLCLPPWAVWHFGLLAGGRMIVTATQLIMLLKLYSFLHEATRDPHTASPQSGEGISLGRVAFFLCAPTLIYRHHYERTARVQWGAVLRYSLLLALAFFSLATVFGRSTLRPLCEGADAALLDGWRNPLLDAAAPGGPLAALRGTLRFLTHCCVLVARFFPAAALATPLATLMMHASHRVLAELLRYKSDLDFTRPWWNAATWVEWFQRWNPYVKAWISRYLYVELAPGAARRRGGFTANRAAKWASIAASAAAHELFVAVCVGYLVPFLAFLYTFLGFVVLYDPLGVQRNRMRGNVFVQGGIMFGVSTLVAYYFLETAARNACPDIASAPWNLIVPHAMLCENPLANCTVFAL